MKFNFYANIILICPKIGFNSQETSVVKKQKLNICLEETI